MDNLVPIVLFLSIFVVPVIAIAWVLITLINSRNKEKLRMINNGIEPVFQKKPAPNKYTTLRNGCLFIGLAVGLFTGIYVNILCDFDAVTTLLILTADTTLCIGIGYIVFFLLVKNKNLDEE